MLVVARVLLDRGYAELLVSGRHPGTGLALPGSLADRFRHEALAMHARVTGPVDAAGRLQVPWPRALGTPPWAVARQLSATGASTAGGCAAGGLPRVDHRVVPAWPDRGALLDRIVAATAEGRPVPVYVGNRWAPRHVVLFLGGVGGTAALLRPGARVGRRRRPAGVRPGPAGARALGPAVVRGAAGEPPEPPATAATGRRSRA